MNDEKKMKFIKDIKNVKELQETNNGIKKTGALLIFHSPFCGHCQRLEPELKKLDKELKKHKINKLIRKVSPEFIDKVDTQDVEIRGVPTIMVVNENGQKEKTFPDDKQRTSDNLLDFMKENDVVVKSQKGGRKTKKNRTTSKNKINKKSKKSFKNKRKSFKNKRKSFKNKRKTLRSKRSSLNGSRRKLY